MTTFVLIHGAGGSGWDWHLVEAELRARGHDVVAPDLPADNAAADLNDYAAAVVAAVGERRPSGETVVVGHSFGGFTAPLVADRLGAGLLVLVTAMIPSPGEAPKDWWENVGYQAAVEEASAKDGKQAEGEDPFVSFYHDVPRDLAEESLRRERSHPTEAANNQPWPLERWPRVTTKFVLAMEDRFFPADWMRRVVADRLGIVPNEIASGHFVALSRPEELATLLMDDARVASGAW